MSKRLPRAQLRLPGFKRLSCAHYIASDALGANARTSAMAVSDGSLEKLIIWPFSSATANDAPA